MTSLKAFAAFIGQTSVTPPAPPMPPCVWKIYAIRVRPLVCACVFELCSRVCAMCRKIYFPNSGTTYLFGGGEVPWLRDAYRHYN